MRRDIGLRIHEPFSLYMSTGWRAQESEEQGGMRLARGIGANGFERDKQSLDRSGKLVVAYGTILCPCPK